MNHTIDCKTRCEWFFELLDIARDHDQNISVEKILLSSSLAKKFISDLSTIKNEINIGRGFFLLKGCPVGNKEIATRENNTKNTCFVSQLVLLGITHALGFNPFGYKQEKEGALVHEIIPEKSKHLSVSSSGRVEFKPHADGAYLRREERPHTLSLLCLNNDSETSTKLILIDELLAKITQRDLELLSNNSFTHFPPRVI